MRLWGELPIGRVVRLAGASSAALALTLASLPDGAPAVLIYRPRSVATTAGFVADAIDELEAVATGLFPAWLPDAAGIAGPGGAGVDAVRRLAKRVAPATAQFGPFLADLAEGALRGGPPHPGRFSPETRVAGLAKVIARSYGRPASALLVDVPTGLAAPAEHSLVAGCEWLANRGGLGVWLTGAPLSTVDWITTETVRLPEPAASIVRAVEPAPRTPDLPVVRFPPLAGRPHPASGAEHDVEKALALLPWAVGRAWNQTHQPRPLEPPVRLDLLWRAERCVVEIDGPEHRDPLRFEADRRRDALLQIDGYVVLRFTNDQVARDLALVVAQIERLVTARRRAIVEGTQHAWQG